LRFSVACEVAQRRLVKIYVLLEEHAALLSGLEEGNARVSVMEAEFCSENLYNYFY
jgi:hypothetical protein